MKTTKAWILNKPDADQTDANFLYGLGCKIHLDILDPDIFEVGGRQYQYTGKNRAIINIITTCEKQEIMLNLKYGDSIILNFKHHEN